MVWAGDAPAFDLSCEAANEVCANALAQCAQEGLAEACDQEQERCDEAAAICAAVSTFLAGLDTDQLDEIACQEAASFSVGSGLFDIKDIRLGNVLNPLKRKKELKRIVKMAAKIGLGYGLATTCTPILVGEDYRGGSAEERVTRAVEALQMRSIPVVVREVSDPTDPNSCSTPLALEFDGQNRVTGFGDFTRSEFVYVSRLGSYPALLTLAEALAFAAGPAAAEFLKSEVGDRLVAVPDLDFDPGIGIPDDALNALEGVVPFEGPALIDIPIIGDLVRKAIGSIPLDLEDELYGDFPGWNTNLASLAAPDVLELGGSGIHQFFAGGHAVGFSADLGVNSFYTQDVFVREYFPPQFTDLPFERTYEALSGGNGVSRSQIPPRQVVGSLVVIDNCDPAPVVQILTPIPGFLPLGVHVFDAQVIDRSGNITPATFTIAVLDTIPPDVFPPLPIGVTVPAGASMLAFADVGLEPPPVFDFASLEPQVSCTIEIPPGAPETCDGAVLPVGVTSTVTWTFTDDAQPPNESMATQEVRVREDGTNLSPVADPASFMIARNITTLIPLGSSDGDLDPLFLRVAVSPEHGTLVPSVDAIFQTRLQLTGTVPEFSNALLDNGDDPFGGGSDCPDLQCNHRTAVVADPENERIFEFGPDTDGRLVLLEQHDLGVEPDSIAMRRTGLTPFGLNPVINSLVWADWYATGTFQGEHVVYNTANGDPLEVTNSVTNPQHVAVFKDGGLEVLLITDPSTSDPSQGAIQLIQSSSSGEHTVQLGFNASGIWPAGQGLFMLADWEQQKVHLWDLTGPLASFSGNGSPVQNAGNDMVWDLSPLFTDPDGPEQPAIPLLGRPRGIQFRHEEPGTFSSSVAFLLNELTDGDNRGYLLIGDDRDKNIKVVELRAQNIEALVGPIPAVAYCDAFDATSDCILARAEKVGGRFVETTAIDTLPSGESMVLHQDRLSHFDIGGTLLADVNLRSGTFSTQFDRIYSDFDLAPDGSVYLVQRSNGVDTFSALVKLNSALNEVDSQQLFGGLIGDTGSSLWSVAAVAGRVFVLGDEGLVSVQLEPGGDLGGKQVHTRAFNPAGCNTSEWCIPQTEWTFLRDLAASPDGSLYVSDTGNRVHAFDPNGAYRGWIGRCDAGTGCNLAAEVSLGFGDPNAASPTACGMAPGNCSLAGDSAGSEDAQFSFAFSGAPKLWNSSSVPLYGQLFADDGRLYVADLPDLDGDDGSDGQPDGDNLPRVQIFSQEGELIETAVPDPEGDGADVNSFIEKGDFDSIRDIAVSPLLFLLAESDTCFHCESPLPGQPAPSLQRLHMFDVDPVQGMSVTYVPDPDYEGPDSFQVVANDTFEDSPPAIISLTIFEDVTAPSLVCPEPVTVEGNTTGGADAIQFELAAFLAGVSATDDALGDPMITNDVTLLPLGITSVTFSAEDGTGNTDSCMAAVTVVDTTPPEISATPVTLEANGLLSVFSVPDFNLVTSDFVGPVTISGLPPMLALGNHSVMWTAMDAGGNQASTIQDVSVVDTTPPALDAVPDIFLTASSLDGIAALAFALPGVTDSVGTDGEVLCSLGDGERLGPGVIRNSCQVLDHQGNVGETSFLVIVEPDDDDADAIGNSVDPNATAGPEFDNGLGTQGTLGSSGVRITGVFDCTHLDANGPDCSDPANAEQVPGVRVYTLPGGSGTIAACLVASVPQLTVAVDGSTEPYDDIVIYCETPSQDMAVEVDSGEVSGSFRLLDERLAGFTLGEDQAASTDGIVVTAGSESAGEILVSLPLDSGPQGDIMLPADHGVSTDGIFLLAALENEGDVFATVDGLTYRLSPGDSVQPLGVPCAGGDSDTDGLPDGCDNCPFVPNAFTEGTNHQLDLDSDGAGDSCDADQDGDGLGNDLELLFGLEPRVPDTDGDGYTDGDDDCPRTFDPLQSDVGRLGASGEDGTGDRCQNGDFDQDGDADAGDVETLRAALAGLEPGPDPRQPPSVPPRRIFVTSSKHTGNLGELAGADAICQARADAAGLGGVFRAWLSDGSESPASRLEQASVPYVLIDGTRVADDWTDLTDGTLQHAINLNETGSLQSGEVWTGTFASGNAFGGNCANWTNDTSSAIGRVGVSHSVTSTWSSVYEQFCNRTNVALYCLEQDGGVLLGDTDGDGVPDADDVCPDTYDPNQRDSGGIGTAAADGVGDACQNADFNADGRANILDVVLWRRALAGLGPGVEEAKPAAPPPARRVFVTSSTHTGNLGGLAGADAICQARAETAALDGIFSAWLSDASESAAGRLEQAAVPYVLIDGTRVADDWSDLTDGSLQHAIDLDETGTAQPLREVWTGTASNGNMSGGNCAGWTDGGNTETGLVGRSDSIGGTWSSIFEQFCDRTNVALYCVE